MFKHAHSVLTAEHRENAYFREGLVVAQNVIHFVVIPH